MCSICCSVKRRLVSFDVEPLGSLPLRVSGCETANPVSERANSTVLHKVFLVIMKKMSYWIVSLANLLNQHTIFGSEQELVTTSEKLGVGNCRYCGYTLSAIHENDWTMVLGWLGEATPVACTKINAAPTPGNSLLL